jgi:hypothetical protein
MRSVTSLGYIITIKYGIELDRMTKPSLQETRLQRELLDGFVISQRDETT